MQPRTLLRSTSHYSIGNLLTTLAGLVSFPFVTRIFSVADYGLMNVVSVTLLALVAVGKLGLQQAVLRFYKAERDSASTASSSTLVSTALLGMTGSGLIVAALWLGLVQTLPPEFLGDGRLRGLFSLISLLAVVQVIDSAFIALLRAEQQTGLITSYQVLRKYAGLGLMIGSVLLIRRDLFVFYGAQILTELAAVAALGLIVVRARGGLGSTVRAFSPPLLDKMVRYGLPLMLGWELSAIVLALGDRYLIQGWLGGDALGTYAAAYNLCQYVESVLVTPWALAVTPMYLRLWQREGKKATAAFLNRSLRHYILVGVPVVSGLAAIAPDLLTIVASEKYRPGAPVIPVVMAGLVIGGAAPITGAGVFVSERTWLAAGCMALSGTANLVLNVVLIPRMGIMGAAVATLLGYGMLLATMTAAGSRQVATHTPWALLARAGFAAAAMYLAVTSVQLGGQLATVAARVCVGALCYAGLVAALEPTAREAIALLLARCRAFMRPGSSPTRPSARLE